MKIQGVLTTREEELLKKLWEFNEPMTQGEMAERLKSEGWNNVTLYKTVQSLTEKGYLEVVGLEKTTKTYARKLIPIVSKEEYYVGILKRNGLDEDSIANITAAFIGVSKSDSTEKNKEVVKQLKKIIRELQEK